LAFLAQALESAEVFGARAMGSRLPFLYRSTDMDSSALAAHMGDALVEPGGAESLLAVERLCQGILRGGSDQLSLRRFKSY
jgi:hypothetical protein